MSRTPTTDRARRTRDRVLDAALELFNERGSTAVTTNHVAARAGISPGNLYYWFSDKDEIIRELYGQLVAKHEGIWEPEADGPAGLTPPELLSRLSHGAALSHEYAFFARDLLGLLHADPVLAAEYNAVRAGRIATFTALARSWRAQAVIKPLADQDIADLVRALWVVAETWMAFAELDGTPVDEKSGTRLLSVVLTPHLTHEPICAPTDGPRGEGETSARITDRIVNSRP